MTRDDNWWHEVRSQKMWCCHKMPQQVSISLAVWCPSPCGRGGASIRMSRDNDIDHGIPWPWMAMRHQVKHAFQSMSNRICSSFNKIFQCLTVCTMTTANSSNTNPFCSLYILFFFLKLFCNGVSFQLMMIVVAIFSYIPNVIYHFVEAIGVLTSTKLSHVLSSGGCEFLSKGDGSLYLSFNLVTWGRMV